MPSGAAVQDDDVKSQTSQKSALRRAREKVGTALQNLFSGSEEQHEDQAPEGHAGATPARCLRRPCRPHRPNDQLTYPKHQVRKVQKTNPRKTQLHLRDLILPLKIPLLRILTLSWKLEKYRIMANQLLMEKLW